MQQDIKVVEKGGVSFGNISQKGLLTVGFNEALLGGEEADDRLIPVILLHPDDFLLNSFWVALGTVLGVFVLFLGGYGLFLLAGPFLLQQLVMLGEGVVQFVMVLRGVVASYAAVIVAAAAFSILPLRVMALVSGFCLVNPVVFFVSALLARSVRQVVMGWLLWRGGVRYKEWLESYYHGVTTVFGVGVLLIFLLVLALMKME